MKRLLYILTILLIGFSSGLFLLSPKAQAYTSTRMIDNGVFDNANSMSESAIRSFINSRPGTCLVNSGAIFPEPKDYFNYGPNNVDAARVIYIAAQTWGLNPQVIITTLQKEQSLLTDNDCVDPQGFPSLPKAMGYYCLEGGQCPPPNYSGFEKQVMKGSWQLKFNKERAEGNLYWDGDQNITYNTYYTQGNRQDYAGAPVVYHDGYITIDGKLTYLENGATASLYRYTPHWPQSFGTIFQGWFGSVYDVYTWSFVSQYAYTDQTKTNPVDLNNLLVGQKVYVGFKAKNTGDTTWSNTGSNPTHVGTTYPQDRASPFCDTSDSPAWMGCSRPANMIEGSVAPGATGTFEFWYKAPAQAGTYDEHFSLVAEGIKWMNDPGLYFHTVVKLPTYTWSLSSQYAYTDQTKSTAANLTQLAPGQKVFIGYQAKNTGNVSWTNSGANPVRSGASSPFDRNSAFCEASWLSCSRPSNVKEASVAPGANGTFEFWYQAPLAAGVYQERFRPVVEGRTWMNDTGLNFYTVVNFDNSGPSILNADQALNTGQSVTSSNGRYRLIMQGDGNLVLYSVSRALWSSGTSGKPVTKAVMQGDGNLVLYDAQNKAYWSSASAGKGSSKLVVQGDGNLVVYTVGGNPTWASRTNGQF